MFNENQHKGALSSAGMNAAVAAKLGAANAIRDTGLPVMDDSTAANQFLNDLDYINSLLGDLLNRQTAQIGRLFGPSPVPGGELGKDPVSEGALGAINASMSAVRSKVSRALDNQFQLERVG